jgi:hypothetical protein
MSDQPEATTKVAAILIARGVKGECPMCDHNEWVMHGQFPHSLVSVPTGPGILQGYGSGYQAYWMYCGNCGFVAQFMKSVVDDPQISADEAIP